MNLKRTALVLLFFIFFGGFLSAQDNPGLVPLTREWVNVLKNNGNFDKLRYYLSEPISLLISEQNNVSRRSNIDINEEGYVIHGEQNATSGSTRVTINNGINDQGTLQEDNYEILEISFKNSTERPVLLKFRPNSQGYYFLFSVVYETRPYNIPPQARPLYLLISVIHIEPLELRAVPNSATGVSQRREIVPQPAYIDGGQPYQQISQQYISYPTSRSRQIMDRGSVTLEGVTRYLGSLNRPVNSGTLSRLIGLYIAEARDEGVNHDIAIAQMLYATNYLDSRNQRVTGRNYGGLSPTREWTGTFPRFLSDGMTEGVRAHIQHIKSYASRAPLNKPRVDPRYQILVNLNYTGTAITFEDLYRHWAENSSYGNNIERILQGLYRYSY